MVNYNMSMEKNYYVIAGYDLTNYKTDKYEDWKWTDDGEQYICYQFKGSIQLFDDPMNEDHLYLGYVLASGDQYYFKTTKLRINEILDMQTRMAVKLKLRYLVEAGVVFPEAESLDCEVIIFEECH